MKRRNYIKLLGASALLSQINLKSNTSTETSGRTLIKPNKLSDGNKVAIIAPASAVSSPNDIF